MASPSNTTMEAPAADLIEDKIISDSNSSQDNREKSREEQPVAEGQVDPGTSERLTALLQVVGAFFLMFNSWGLTNTFGAYQNFYETGILKSQTPSQISWIGSIQACLLLVVGGFIAGPIFDAGYLRGLVIFGSAAAVFGMMMTSICKEYWEVVLAQGVVTGIGLGFMLLPSVAVMPQYFKTRRAFATGIAASGSSLGGIIYPTIFHQLEPKIGFGWTTRVIAFIMLGTLMIPIVVMKAKVFPSQRRPLIDFQVLRKPSYDLFCLGTIFSFMGMYVPFYYISSFGVSHGIVNAKLGFYLLTILNGASVFGRIVPNFFADKIGPLNMMTPLVLLLGIIAYTWTSTTSAGQIIVFCIFYGFFSGTLVSITGPAIVVISPDLSLVGTHMGMNFGITGLGLLIGNPVAGVLLDRHGYIGPAIWCGTCNVVGGLLILAARISKTGAGLMAKA